MGILTKIIVKEKWSLVYYIIHTVITIALFNNVQQNVVRIREVHPETAGVEVQMGYAILLFCFSIYFLASPIIAHFKTTSIKFYYYFFGIIVLFPIYFFIEKFYHNNAIYLNFDSFYHPALFTFILSIIVFFLPFVENLKKRDTNWDL